ncbi:MAG: ribosome maturation factor RimM [Lactobacillus sp.]|jgi:16S rRNA processing protein RimM|nr:ribosome maturation factor RimM [Lactobacillus sp.]
MENKICLGVITGVHGIKGEVKVKSFTEIPEDIDQYGQVESQDGSKKFDIKVVGNSKELLRVKIKGVDDRNAAESLKGTEFYVSRDLLPDLDEEEFYHTDLIGLNVKSPDGEVIGKVLALYNFGAGDLIEIKFNSDNKVEMIPFTLAYVPEINIKDAIIVSSEALELIKSEKEDEG